MHQNKVNSYTYYSFNRKNELINHLKIQRNQLTMSQTSVRVPIYITRYFRVMNDNLPAHDFYLYFHPHKKSTETENEK